MTSEARQAKKIVKFKPLKFSLNKNANTKILSKWIPKRDFISIWSNLSIIDLLNASHIDLNHADSRQFYSVWSTFYKNAAYKISINNQIDISESRYAQGSSIHYKMAWERTEIIDLFAQTQMNKSQMFKSNPDKQSHKLTNSQHITTAKIL